MIRLRVLASVCALTLITVFTTGGTSCRQAKFVELTIFHTNDLHSHLHPPVSNEFELGGLAKMATLLEKLRPGRQAAITLDAGDWSEGSWYFSLDTGANMLRLLNAMKYDAVVVGNHDYLVGPDRLMATIDEAGVPLPTLASNLDFSAYPKEEEFRRRIPSTIILERSGIKIGIIGLTTVDYPFAPYLAPLKATAAIDDAQRQAKILRPQVDVLIILSHNHIDNNIAIARAVLGVDAVVSGHSHRKFARAELVQNAGRVVPVVETGEWGQFVGDLRLRVDRERKVVQFLGYDLHPVLPSLPDHPEVVAMIAHEDERLNQFFGGNVREVVAHTDTRLEHDDSHRAGLGDLATKGYRDATGAEIAMEPLSLTGVKIPEGDVTIEQLHDVMPHIFNWDSKKEWTIKIWEARGKDLAAVLDIVYTLPNALPVPPPGFIAFDGAEVTYQPRTEDQPVPVVKNIQIGQSPIDLSRTYQVALTDGMILALQIINEKLGIGFDLSRMHDTGIEGWRAVLNYARKVKHLKEDDLRRGGRSYTTSADPMISRFSYDAAAGGVRVLIANDGLSTLEGAQLRCFAGLRDNPVLWETDDQAFSDLGSISVPAVEPLAKASVVLPWRPDAAGLWPMRCGVISPQDGRPSNSFLDSVLHVQAGVR